MKIKLKTITLQNFKSIVKENIDFKGRDAIISGANGTGKTSIYEGYYWCLFGKTLSANGIVQTLDKSNEVIHKIDTVVEVVLNINDEYDVKIRRALMEDWKAKNTPEEHFNGTKTQRFWNDVPVSKAEYNRKLESLVPVEQWQLLSNNFAFMSYKMEDRRRMLLSIAGEIDETKLMAKFPAIQKAVKERKSIEELDKQTKNTRKNANMELTEIPAKISAQDALKVNIDNKEKSDNVAKVERYFQDLRTIQDKINDYKNSWNKQNDENISNIRKQLLDAQDKAAKIGREITKNSEEQQQRINRLAIVTEAFNKSKIEWGKVNDEQFDFKQSDVCPICKRELPEAFKRTQYANAVAEYNANKSQKLDAIMKEAQKLSEQKNVLQRAIKSFNEITKPKLDNSEKVAVNLVAELEKSLTAAKEAGLDTDKEYAKLLATLETIKSTQPDNANDVVKYKADQEINKRVEKEKIRLQKRSAELSQIIADCDNTLYQIFNYKKTKIDAVEDKVNGLFTLVRWKFFQQNVTNDDLQEICTCIVNGVDFNNLNTASKVNASVDIVNGISKATGIYVPCWIDNRESVTNLIHTDSQQIALKVVDKKPLQIQLINQ